MMLLSNYFKIAFRNLARNKTFACINIAGLSVAITACIFIGQFASFEFSFDRFHAKSDRIYRIISDVYREGKRVEHGSMTFPAVGSMMQKDYEEIALNTRILIPFGESIVKANNEMYLGDNCVFADGNFLSVFDFPLVAGSQTALAEKQNAILSHSMAAKYFGNIPLDSIIGKEFYWSTGPTPYVVKAICKDVPENSHIKFDVLLSYSSLYTSDNRDFDESLSDKPYIRHYVLLQPGVSPILLEHKLKAFADKYFGGIKEKEKTTTFFLQPLTRIHLYPSFDYEYAKTASGNVVWALIWIAGFILVIAWINYVNMTTARSLNRAKEVGIKKIIGAHRSQLIIQFVTESIITTAIALMVAVALTGVLQSSFNAITQIFLSPFQSMQTAPLTTVFGLIGILLVGIAFSGLYPAFLLSSLQPITALKGKFSRSQKGNLIRKILVVFQFTSACVLVIGTFVVSEQMDFLQKKDKGLAIGNTMVIAPPMRTSLDSSYQERVKTFKNALTQLAQVAGVASSSHVPGSRPYITSGIRLSGRTEQYTADQLVIDEDYFSNYKIKLVAGRSFVFSDSNYDWGKVNNIVINVKALEMFGLTTDNALSSKIYIGDKEWNVIGVVRDFHQQSLHNTISPTLFTPDYNPYNPLSVKLIGTNYQSAIGDIKLLFKEHFPDNAFSYYFLENTIDQQYSDERKFGILIKVFASIAILISSLGLISLAAYGAIQRTKEIGIRKVLGATVANILGLLTLDFIKLTLLAAILSLPLVYLAANKWLSQYAYRISPALWMYVIPLGGIVLLATTVTTMQIWKTATQDPSETLKHE